MEKYKRQHRDDAVLLNDYSSADLASCAENMPCDTWSTIADAVGDIETWAVALTSTTMSKAPPLGKSPLKAPTFKTSSLKERSIASYTSLAKPCSLMHDDSSIKHSPSRKQRNLDDQKCKKPNIKREDTPSSPTKSFFARLSSPVQSSSPVKLEGTSQRRRIGRICRKY